MKPRDAWTGLVVIFEATHFTLLYQLSEFGWLAHETDNPRATKVIFTTDIRLGSPRCVGSCSDRRIGRM